ncbi:MAG: methyl-accepting chemotaxis protein, partial [Burkholderiaceae bacterium]|nr:methyl-accepting chemotaxis protein [Burkholderiaceae bacterium]
MAAAASSLNGQAGDMVNTVAVFKLPLDAGRIAPQPAPKPQKTRPVAAAAAVSEPQVPVKPKAVSKPTAPSLAAPTAPRSTPSHQPEAEDDWESF